MLRAGAVERQGPDPQGAPVRADQQRGQPRRGRQGVLLLPRQHPDPLVHEVPLQVSAGQLSHTRTWSRPTARRGRTEFEYELLDTGVFDEDRYFDVFVEYAKAAPEDILIRITVVQPRARAGATLAPAADAVVPQHVVVAMPTRSARRSCRSPVAHGHSVVACRRTPQLGERYAAIARGTSRCCSPRTRPTRSGCSASRTDRPTSRTASTTTSCMAGRTR